MAWEQPERLALHRRAGDGSRRVAAPRACVTLLHKQRTPATEPFWAEIERDDDQAPLAVQELVRGDSTVVCTPAEAVAALGWARRRWHWRDEAPAVTVVVQ